MLIGYARVSTTAQTADLQHHAFAAAGIETVFTDYGVGGRSASHPELDKCMAELSKGDTLVVWRLDRLTRSLRSLLTLVDGLGARGIRLQSLTESIDTSTASGRLALNVAGALAEFERDLLKERTAAGMEAARARGARIGRPAVVTRDQLAQARTLVSAGHRVGDVAKTLGVGRSTLYRALRDEAA